MSTHPLKTVRVTSPEGGYATGTRVVDTRTGEEIKGIARIAIPEFAAGDLIKVDLTLCLAVLLVEGTPVFQVADPRDGKLKQISSVQFADGTEFKA